MEFYLSRQPVFDRQKNVFAYELLFHRGLSSQNDAEESDYAASSILTAGFLTIDAEVLSRGKMTFVNFTQNLLLNEVATLFPPNLIAIEITENMELTDQILAVCKKLKRDGYLMVFDFNLVQADVERTLGLADIISADLNRTGPEEIAEFMQQNDVRKVKFLARNVETIAVFDLTCDMGFTYFAGDFFAKPMITSGRNVSSHKLSYLRLLQEINRPQINLDTLDEIVRQDVTLSYKLLSYINSAFFGFPNQIKTTRHALSLIGIQEAKKWLSLIALSSMGEEKTDELIVGSLIRAKFYELLAPLAGLQEQSNEFFLMGLFSMLDALLDQPMSELLSNLPISDNVKNTLLDHSSPYREVFQLILYFEKGDWDTFRKSTEQLNLPADDLPRLYFKALTWAHRIFSR